MSKDINAIISVCKRRGFVYPGSEIYGGFSNSYTYGPYGVELKQNLKNLWWKMFVRDHAEIVGIDADIILHPKTWEASGHVSEFNDPLVDCKACKSRHRADHIIENQVEDVIVEGLPDEEITKILRDQKVKCPKCGSTDLTDVRKFNLMFSTEMSKVGESQTAYLRPETAQAMFLEYKNILDSMRVKLPFGIAQMGKAFRNEITPGNFIFRRLEFEQMEIEYFIRENEWEKWFSYWQKQMKQWCEVIGLDPQKCHDYEHADEQRSHYSKRTVDIEYDFPFGRKELYGLAYRTDFDLSQHEKFSGKNLQYFDEETKEKFIPHVIEPTWGVDRSILAVLCEAYEEETLEDESTRIVLKIKPSLAPVKVGVLPLMKKDGLPEKAHEVHQILQNLGNIEYDESGNIGKRYRRQDEIGTPVCITIDHDTLEDQTVTMRDRDTMKQERVAIAELSQKIAEIYF